MAEERTAIEVDGLGVRFRLGRRGRRSVKDLFAGKKRRNRPGGVLGCGACRSACATARRSEWSAATDRASRRC